MSRMKAVGNMVNKITEVASTTLKVSAKLLAAPLIFPSLLRRSKETSSSDKSFADDKYALFGLGASLTYYFSHGAALLNNPYYKHLQELAKEYWYMPLITLGIQSIDGIYEWYNYEKNKIQASSGPIYAPLKHFELPTFKTSEKKPSELELKATEAPKIEIPQEKPLNPWDTDIPKYDNLTFGGRR